MDTQSIINALFALAGALGGFILRATWTALETMRKDLQTLQASLSETYVRRDDFREMKEALVRIEAKLDQKADK